MSCFSLTLFLPPGSMRRGDIQPRSSLYILSPQSQTFVGPLAAGPPVGKDNSALQTLSPPAECSLPQRRGGLCLSHSAFQPPEHLWVFAPDLSCGSQQTPHTPNGLCRFPGSGPTSASSTWLLISLGMHEQVRGICSSSHCTLACLSFLLSRLKFKSGSGKGLANVVQISNSEGAERQFLVLCLKVP